LGYWRRTKIDLALSLGRHIVYVQNFCQVVSSSGKLNLHKLPYMCCYSNLPIENMTVQSFGRINHQPWNLYITYSMPYTHSCPAVTSVTLLCIWSMCVISDFLLCLAEREVLD
jgi:hypothetical protein